MKRALVALVLLAPALAAADPDATVEIDRPDPLPVAKPHHVRRWYFRAGLAYVDPLSTSRELELSGVDGPASLAVQNGPIAGSGATIESTTTPAAIIGYVLPKWHDRFAIETILGLPLTVKMQATGTLATQSIAPTALGIPTGIMPLGSQLGEASAIPPVVTMVYSLLPRDGALRPYVGAGAAVMISYNARVTNPVLTANGKPDFSIPPAPGAVVQAGIDATLFGRVYARLDVKYIALMLARGEVHNISMSAPDLPLFGSVEVGTAKMDVWVNPLIIQLGIGTDF